MSYHINPVSDIFRKKLIGFLGAITIVASAGQFASAADPQKRSSSTITRRGLTESVGEPGVETQIRRQKLLERQETADADLQWLNVLYRQLDLNSPANSPLIHPFNPRGETAALFDIMIKAVVTGKAAAYDPMDPSVVLEPSVILDRYHVPYGKTVADVDPLDLPTEEVLSYYIVEHVYFDSRVSRLLKKVDAICPVLHRSGEFGEGSLRYPMFWLKLDDIRSELSEVTVALEPGNDMARHTLDDFFTMNFYDGEIYRTRSEATPTLAQLHPDPDDLSRSRDSLEQRITRFDSLLWVPSREEILSRRNSMGDSIVIPSRDVKENQSKSVSRQSRSKRGGSKVSGSNNSGNSSAAVRSVRRRR